MNKMLLTLLVLPILSFLFINNSIAGTLADGACCTDDDVCSVLSVDDCFLVSDIWLGPDTTCEMDTCDLTPSSGDCCDAHGGTGCNDSECETTVCETYGFCCDVTWDLICVDYAFNLCGDLCMGDSPLPPGACCSGVDDCSIATIAECQSEGGFALQPSTTDCEPNPCIVDGTGDCCSEHNSTGCETSECQQTVCAQDAFCCFVEWDNICVEEAQDLCGGLCEISGPVAIVPTMGQWGMVIASILLGFFGIIRLWRIKDSEI